MEILPPDPPTPLQSVTSPVKICSTCFFVRPLIGFPEFTITAIPSKATIVGFMFFPLDAAAPTSEVLARRLDMPICAVPSMMAAIPVVDPSAAMSKVVPGCSALKCSANCGTSFAPSVSEPLMKSRSALASAKPNATATVRIRGVNFIISLFLGDCLPRRSGAEAGRYLEFYVQVSLENLVLIERVDRDIVRPTGAESVVTSPAIAPGEVVNNCLA